jgi:hypothetical protein
MLYFGGRDLMEFTELAGFRAVHLDLEANIKPKTKGMDWNTFLRGAGNPRITTFAKAIREALTFSEIEPFIAHLRSRVEFKQRID